jgi:hypothetical protein
LLRDVRVIREKIPGRIGSQIGIGRRKLQLHGAIERRIVDIFIVGIRLREKHRRDPRLWQIHEIKLCEVAVFVFGDHRKSAGIGGLVFFHQAFQFIDFVVGAQFEQDFATFALQGLWLAAATSW